MMTKSYRGQPIFGPRILIGIGFIWLLATLDILHPPILQVLFRLWPLLLLIIGHDLLFWRKYPDLGFLTGIVLISLGSMALLLALALFVTALGSVHPGDVKEQTYGLSTQGVTSANVNIYPSAAGTTIKALADSSKLMDANLNFVGDVDFSVSDGPKKTIWLKNTNNRDIFNVLDFGLFNHSQNLRWNIGLSKDVPLTLDVTGDGSITIDLTSIQITKLWVDSSAGNLDLVLPSRDKSYSVSLDTGTGSSVITVEKNADVDINIRGSTGSITIDVPDDAAVSVGTSMSFGKINVPSSYVHTSSLTKTIWGVDGSSQIEDNTWQTVGYDTAPRHIFISYSESYGDLTIR